MDVLTDKQQREYDYISRYSSFSFYYNNQDGKYIYEVTSQLSDNIEYVAHKITQSDTLDSLSYYYYGRPDLYWVIADFNRIQDPFVRLFGNYKSLKVPKLSNISYQIKG